MSSAQRSRAGLWAGVVAYTAWGLFPLYWRPLQQVPAMEILAHRIAWSLVFLGAVLAVQRHWGWLAVALRTPSLVGRFALSATMLSGNWFLFIWAVNDGRVVEASLGYFINPLVNVLLGRVVLGERLRPGQQLSVALAVAGVAWQALALGALPWVSLALAGTFGLYGLMRKTASLGSLEGLTLETLLLAPLAVGYLLWLERAGVGHLGHVPPVTEALLVGAGVVTAVPLLLFATAARRLPLATLGLLQFIAPTLQFVVGVAIFAEPLQRSRLVGFGFIWAAVLLFSAESLLVARRPAPSGSK